MSPLVKSLRYQFLGFFFRLCCFFFLILNLPFFCYLFYFHCPFLFQFILLLLFFLFLSVFAILTSSALVSNIYHTFLDILLYSSLLFSNWFQDCSELAMIFPKLNFISILQLYWSPFSPYVPGNKYLLLIYIQ